MSTHSATPESDRVTIETSYGGYYSITRAGFEAECRAKQEGHDAKNAGVAFHDNPYRKGPPSPDDWLYSAWEYGYINGPNTSRIVDDAEGAS